MRMPKCGTYSDDSHIKHQEFADGTWGLTYGVPKFTCMVHAKYGFEETYALKTGSL